jgi:predicted amidohydrolase YtcJ
MNRRNVVATGAELMFPEFPFRLAYSLQASARKESAHRTRKSTRMLWFAVSTLFVLLHLVFAYGQTPDPDLVLVNGKIFTSNTTQPFIQALAIRGDRIAAVGTSEEMKRLAGRNTRIVDLGGRTAIPGFNDAHIHLGIHPTNWVQLQLQGPDPSWSELKAAILKAPKNVGLMADIGLKVFYDTDVNRDLLDQVAPDQPVMLSTLTYHAAILNSAALKVVGVREDLADPMGGRYERSPDGKLTGVLREYSARAAFRKLTDLTSDTDALSELRKRFDEFARLSITSIQDMSNEIAPEHCVALLKQIPTPIRVRVIRMPNTTPKGRDTQEGRSLPNHPAPLLTISGMKWMLDGVPVENTFEPRQRAAGQPPKQVEQAVAELGMTFPNTELRAMLQESLRDHDQLLLHVGGYPASAAMLDAMQAAAGKKVWAGRRVRFEHGDGLFPDLVPRVKEFGIVVVQNPAHLNARAMAPQLFHETPTEKLQPLRSLIEAGIPVAIGSDGLVNPYINILLASTHPDRPSEAITREQAVIAYTLTSAYAEFAEKDKGTLEAGKLADLAVLSQDIFTVSASDLPRTTSLLTIVGGKVVYDANVIKLMRGPSHRTPMHH